MVPVFLHFVLMICNKRYFLDNLFALWKLFCVPYMLCPPVKYIRHLAKLHVKSTRYLMVMPFFYKLTARCEQLPFCLIIRVTDIDVMLFSLPVLPSFVKLEHLDFVPRSNTRYSIRSPGLYNNVKQLYMITITWTNVDFLLVRYSDTHLRTNLQWVPKQLFPVMSLKIILSNYCPWVNYLP